MVPCGLELHRDVQRGATEKQRDPLGWLVRGPHSEVSTPEEDSQGLVKVFTPSWTFPHSVKLLYWNFT